MSDEPRVAYARSGDIHIAYRVSGRGPIDVVLVPAFVSNLDFVAPDIGLFIPAELSAFARVIQFDKRGTGLSDRVDPGTVEERMDDIRAVMDAAGSERAAIFGTSDGGPLAIMFAATYPERTLALILSRTFARRAWAADYPWGASPEAIEEDIKRFEREWGTGAVIFRRTAADATTVASSEEWSLSDAARYERAGATPGAAAVLRRRMYEIDVREFLGSIRVPTLVTHPKDDPHVAEAHGRYLADHIPEAKYVTDFAGRAGKERRRSVLDEYEEFLTGARGSRDPDRVLATVMFTDIVGSTQRAAELGDRQWRSVLETHHAISSREIDTHRGRTIKTTGDGVLATFDGPARGVHCACSIRNALRDVGVDIRAGLHTGEVELLGNDIGGIAVHVGQRVSALAGPGEVLVSSTIVDLVAGAGLDFDDKGEHQLKGVPRPWRIYSVSS